MGTQWSIGFGGATGLRYEALYPLIDRIAKSDDEWQELFEDVRIMEIAALEAQNKDK